MPSSITVLKELPTLDNVYVVVKAIIIYISCYIHHDLYTQGFTLENMTLNHLTLEYKIAKKVYYINNSSHILKRSLR
jgi:hypothetical protein